MRVRKENVIVGPTSATECDEVGGLLDRLWDEGKLSPFCELCDELATVTHRTSVEWRDTIAFTVLMSLGDKNYYFDDEGEDE